MLTDKLRRILYMKQYYLLLFIFLFWGCMHSSSKQTSATDSVSSAKEPEDTSYEVYHSLSDMKVNLKLDTSQFYVIDTVCAVSVSPDSTWFNEQQKSMQEDEWSAVADDHVYYESTAEDTLEACHIRVFYKKDNRRYLKFVKQNKQEVIIDRSKKKDLWGLILFNGKDDPVFWSDIDISEVLKTFYNK